MQLSIVTALDYDTLLANATRVVCLNTAMNVRSGKLDAMCEARNYSLVCPSSRLYVVLVYTDRTPDMAGTAGRSFWAQDYRAGELRHQTDRSRGCPATGMSYSVALHRPSAFCEPE